MKKLEFRDLFLEQIKRHSAMEPQDVVKLCYQAAFGAEHLLQDEEAAYRYLEQEYDAVEADSEPLYEWIHPDVCRVNLAAWKREQLPLKWLFRMFAMSADNQPEDGRRMFRECVESVGTLIEEQEIERGTERGTGLTGEKWHSFLSKYPVDQPAAVHHSEEYRRKERPAYRLVCGRFVRMFPILQAIAKLSSEVKVVAIDGRCASGKTTLAGQLKQVTGAGLVHMDDFFLPPELRTEERLEEAGGNVHHERFMAEVLPHIAAPQSFRYRRFDCSRMELGNEREVPTGTLRIVEGVYSCHPALGQYMDLKVFCSVEHEEQLRRIKERDGCEMLEHFRNQWIPMEERYFQHFKIQENAEIVLMI